MVAAKTKTQEILTKGEKTLSSLDEWFASTALDAREFPHFNAAEIVAGIELGRGGFSSVYEVDRIDILGTTPEGVVDKPGDSASKSNSDHHDHYDVVTARDFMSQHYKRDGSARYAIKKLRSDLGEIDRVRGGVDLAIEITILTTVWHPNIIKMRGYSKTPRVSSETFIILDRLYGTLHDKIEIWAQSVATCAACCGASESSPAMLDLLKLRLLVAYDLSRAINYLHELKILYRDLKPDNIGFDVRGDVKLFDFGLSRSLDPSLKEKDGYGYNLSGKTGSIPYMAPEIAKGKPYSYEVDVFSFSILLWEIISLEWAFNGLDAFDYFLQVCARDVRLPIKKKWPAMVRVIIQEGWDPKPQERPSMKRVGTLLRGELDELFSDVDMTNRNTYMMNKSMRSARGMIGNSQRGRNGSLRNSMLGSRSNRHMYVDGDVCGDNG